MRHKATAPRRLLPDQAIHRPPRAPRYEIEARRDGPIYLFPERAAVVVLQVTQRQGWERPGAGFNALDELNPDREELGEKRGHSPGREVLLPRELTISAGYGFFESGPIRSELRRERTVFQAYHPR